MFLTAGRIPVWFMRLGPALRDACMTTAAVIFSGDAISGYALFYLWVGLYVFYFPLIESRRRRSTSSGLALNYAFAIAVTPIAPPGGAHAAISHFVITAGTLITAATLLTYLRGRVERLLGQAHRCGSNRPLTGLPNRVALHEALERELERATPHGRPVSLIVIDLDRFKRVNERLGHRGRRPGPARSGEPAGGARPG